MSELKVVKWISIVIMHAFYRECRVAAAGCARELALAYHRLHKSALVSGSPEGRAAGVVLALSAVNMAEAAGEALAPELLAEIYVGAALRAKESLPAGLQFCNRYN